MPGIPEEDAEAWEGQLTQSGPTAKEKENWGCRHLAVEVGTGGGAGIVIRVLLWALAIGLLFATASARARAAHRGDGK